MIQGIDGQIMIQRTAEYSKQQSDHVNQAQQGKEFVAQLERERAARELKDVNQTEEMRHKTVDRDAGKNREGKQEKEQEEQAASEQEQGMRLPTSKVYPSKTLGTEIDINI